MEVRPLDRPEDVGPLEALLAEYLQLVADQFDPPRFDPVAALADTMDHLAQTLPPKGRTFGAFEGDAILGTAMVRMVGPGRAELKRFYVRPETRGRGVGAALLGAAIRQAQTLGATVLLLDTVDSLTAARRLYEGFGFRERGAYDEADSLRTPRMLDRIVFYERSF
ncbi:N-acetyltransferase [Wenxinia marina]|nr:N-acetyltransferase [Wenxinia marina]